MKKINIQHESEIKAEGKLNSGHCKPIICLETGEVFTSVADAAEKAGMSAQNLSTHLTGKRRTFAGKHYCYLSRVSESLDSIVTRLRETAAMEEDARRWREYHAEQEAIRKAEEKRLEAERKAQEKHEADIAKARDKVEKLRAKYENMQAKYVELQNDLCQAEIELEALEDMEG